MFQNALCWLHSLHYRVAFPHPFFRDNVPLRGGTAVGHCRKALRRDIAVVQCFGVCNVILQSSAAVGTAMGHCSEALQRGTAVEHCWVAAVGHCNGALQ